MFWVYFRGPLFWERPYGTWAMKPFKSPFNFKVWVAFYYPSPQQVLPKDPCSCMVYGQFSKSRPQLGPPNTRCRIRLRTPKRTINFDNHPSIPISVSPLKGRPLMDPIELGIADPAISLKGPCLGWTRGLDMGMYSQQLLARFFCKLAVHFFWVFL